MAETGPPLPAAGFVPAAGLSSRMGSPKALLPLDGVPFLVRTIRALREGGCSPVIVSVRDSGDEIGLLALSEADRVVVPSDPERGPIAGLQAALPHVEPDRAGLMVLPVDHPLVQATTVTALLEAGRASPESLILQPTCSGRSGHPVLFRSEVFPELMEQDLAEGARTVVRRDPERVGRIEVEDPGILANLDTPADLSRHTGAQTLTAREAAAEILARTGAGDTVALLQTLGLSEAEGVGAGAEAGAGARAGRMLVCGPTAGGAVLGSLGSSTLDAQGIAAAQTAVRDPGTAPGVIRLPGPEGEAIRVFMEIHHPADGMVIVGAGHIAQPLAQMGALLGMDVSVLDDRPEWARKDRFPDASRVLQVDFDDPFRDTTIHARSHVVLVTRGHRYDYECLVRLLRLDPAPAYIGMIGSRRRVRATFAQLGAEGFGPDVAARIWAPIGLDIGAQTPTEIAVAVAAEIVLARRGGAGTPLRDLERVADRFMESDADKLGPEGSEGS